jgi:hypothetical protein
MEPFIIVASILPLSNQFGEDFVRFCLINQPKITGTVTHHIMLYDKNY